MILDNIKAVRGRIAGAARRAGRDPDSVELVAVTKKASVATVKDLLETGLIRQIGESRVQDATVKATALRADFGPPRVTWRMVGHLQTNKARAALDFFDAVDSLDSLRLAEALEAHLADSGRKLPVLVQVKLGGRETQAGVDPEGLEGFLKACRRYERLQLRGLMAIGPMLDPAEAVRPYFRRLKALFDRSFPEGGDLSMGMSRDLEVAVEEGTTMVRVGTALFA